MQAVDQYRVKVAEVGQLREQVGELIEQSKIAGDIESANKLFEELTLRTAELNSLRQTIGLDPAAKLLLTYVVRVLGEHTISFFVPEDCPKSAIFEEAVEVAGSGYQPYQDVPKYLRDEHPRYSDYKSRTGRICIDACVEGSRAMNREEQLHFLGQRGLEMATLPDLIVAHALFYVATGRSLFGAPDAKGFTSHPRAVGGSLNFQEGVLRALVGQYDLDDGKGRIWVASARIRS